MINVKDLIQAVEALALAHGQADAAEAAVARASATRETSIQAATAAVSAAADARAAFLGQLRAVGEQSKAAVLMATRSANVGVQRSAGKTSALTDGEARLKIAQGEAEAKQKLLVRGQTMAAELAAIRDAIIRAHELAQQAADSRQDADSRYTEQKLSENRAAAMKAAEAAASQAGNLNVEVTALVDVAETLTREVAALRHAKETEDAATHLSTQTQHAATAVEQAVSAYRTQYAG